MKNFLLFILTFWLQETHASQRVRRVEVHADQIVTVRTSLGIATIIQVPDRPNSVVVGDQDAFKVEYLDQAITIKPLSSGAKSNLYVYTDWKRFNVELISGLEASADYVVYLENPKERPVSSTTPKKDPIVWTEFKNVLKNESVTIEVKRVGRMRKEIYLAEFIIRSKKKENFKPDWLWVTQNNVTKPIHHLVLSSLEVTPSKPITGVIQIRPLDIDLALPIRIELRRKKLSFLTIPKVAQWK